VQIYQSDMGESSYIVFDYINGELLWKINYLS
jgi:hypothetical protein